MNTATPPATDVDVIARTCLYEGYLLWPYRRSALKNTKRWTFGGVFPAGPCARALGERPSVTTQVLLERNGPPCRVEVSVRFLHVVDRTVHRLDPEGPVPVDALTVDGVRHLTWQEATEREVRLTVGLPGDGTGDGREHTAAVDIPAGSDTEPLTDTAGHRHGEVVRRWQALNGTLTVRADAVTGTVHRLTVRVDNTTACPAPDPGDRAARERAAAYAFASTHVVLRGTGGRFVSLMDPPPELAGPAGSCAQDGLWPVLAGEGAGQRADTVLASPLTLYDFPAVAPESPGDLFDGTEIDQLLVLSVLSMTREEQAEARACDPRAREILERCAGLGLADMTALHGAIREFRPSAPLGGGER